MTTYSSATPPELELLLACSRTARNAPQTARIAELIAQPLDWDDLLKRADDHRLTPLLYWHLHEFAANTLPKRVADHLKGQMQATATHNLLLTSELLQLLQVFAHHNIRAIPYKGPALATFTYGNLSLRQFADLDLFIARRDLPRVYDLLVARGYVIPEDGVPLDVLFRDHYHYEFVHPGLQRHVEVHWAFTRSYWAFPLDLEDIWNRAEALRWGGVEMQVFRADDLLLILCAHGAKHFWAKLCWICDVAEIVRTQPMLDWRLLVARAEQMGCLRVLLLGLYLAHDLLDAELPDIVLAWLRAEADVAALAAQIRQRFVQGKVEQMNGVAARVFYWKLRERRIDRMRYMAYHLRNYLAVLVLPKAQERSMLPLPAALAPVYLRFAPLRRGLARVRQWGRAKIRAD